MSGFRTHLSFHPRLMLTCFLPMLAACSAQVPKQGAANAALAPLPAASPLKFSEFYQMPVGSKGLEPTAKLQSLAGKTVRVEGFMVQEEEPLPGLFMMTSTPVTMAELADGPADFLPAATLFVQLPDGAPQRYVHYEPGLWTAVGRLELGAREETNGRVSYARLRLARLDEVRAPGNRQPDWLDTPPPSGHRHGH